MQEFARFVLIMWFPLTVGIFAAMPARKAVIVSLIGAWLLLPPISIPMVGMPDYSKYTAATIGILLATVIFQLPRLLSLKPQWFDAPILVWCFYPFVSSLGNGLTAYDGVSMCLGNIFLWGFPYLVGRLYFGDLESLRALTLGIIAGGVAYILPCIWEMRFSAQLANNFYGMGGAADIRLGGYRPRVFLSNGLELGMWMSAASMAAWWIWRTNSLKEMAGLSFGRVIFPALMVTNVLCKSSGALMLLLLGMGTLKGSMILKTRVLLLGIMLATPLYYVSRVSGAWTGVELIDILRTHFDPERAQSLEYRFFMENLLINKAVQQPILGWAGWGRNLDVDPAGLVSYGFHSAVPDGLWIIAFGTLGWVGLTSVTLVVLLPPILFLIRYEPSEWLDPPVAPAAFLSVLLSLYMIDCLANAMVNLIYIVAMGGLVAIPARRHLPTPLNADASDTVHAPRQSVEGRSGLQLATPALPTLEITSGSVPVGTAGTSGHAPETPQEKLARRYSALGRSLASQGRSDQAKATWLQALDLWTRLTSAHPGHPRYASSWCDCCNDIAWFLLQEPEPELRNVSQAVALATKATETFPDHATYWNTLGAAYFRSGDFPAAADALHRALFLQDDRGTAFDYLYLAMACAQLMQHDIAQAWYNQGMDWIEERAPHHLQLRKLGEEAKESLNHANFMG